MIFWSHHQRCRGQKKAPKLRSWWQDVHPQQQRIIPKPHPSTTSTYDCNDLFNTLKCIASEIVVSVIAGIGSIHGLRFQWWMEPICRISQNLLTPQSVHFVFIDRYGSYKKRQVLGFFFGSPKNWAANSCDHHFWKGFQNISGRWSYLIIAYHGPGILVTLSVSLVIWGWVKTY